MAVDILDKIRSLRLARAIATTPQTQKPRKRAMQPHCLRTVLASLTGDYAPLGMRHLLEQGEKEVGKHLDSSRNGII